MKIFSINVNQPTNFSRRHFLASTTIAAAADCLMPRRIREQSQPWVQLIEGDLDLGGKKLSPADAPPPPPARGKKQLRNYSNCANKFEWRVRGGNEAGAVV